MLMQGECAHTEAGEEEEKEDEEEEEKDRRREEEKVEEEEQVEEKDAEEDEEEEKGSLRRRRKRNRIRWRTGEGGSTSVQRLIPLPVWCPPPPPRGTARGGTEPHPRRHPSRQGVTLVHFPA
jgi:hypothetical protein